MQGILSFSGRWHDPLPGLRRAAYLLLAIISLEISVILLQHAWKLPQPIYLLLLLRCVDTALLMACGTWTVWRSGFKAEFRNSILIAALLGAAGIAFLILWKGLFGASLFEGMNKGLPLAVFPLTAFLVASCLLGPVVEELVFRGILYRLFRDTCHPWISAVFVSILFASLHTFFGKDPFVPFIGSLLFCLVYEMTKTILTPVLVHMTGNLIIYLVPLLPFA